MNPYANPSSCSQAIKAQNRVSQAWWVSSAFRMRIPTAYPDACPEWWLPTAIWLRYAVGWQPRWQSLVQDVYLLCSRNLQKSRKFRKWDLEVYVYVNLNSRAVLGEGNVLIGSSVCRKCWDLLGWRWRIV